MNLDPVFLEQYLEKLQRKAESFKLSRRRFLLGSVAAASVSKAFLWSTDRVRFEIQAGSALILLDGTPRWVIAPERFGSESTLDLLRHTQDEVRIRLTNARLPGTMLAAEMQCNFRRVMGSWTFDFELGEMGRASRVDLIGWLSGNPVYFIIPTTSFFPTNSAIRLRSTAGLVSLDTSWTFMFPGGEAEITGVRGALPVSKIALQVAPSGYRSALLGGRRAASLITLERKEHAWGTKIFDLLERNGCTLNGHAELFHSIEIESCGSALSPEFSAVFVPGNEPAHALRVPGAFQDRDGEPFELALTKPIYAITSFGVGRVQSTFTSSLREQHVALASSYAMVFDKPLNLQSNTDDPEVQDRLDFGLSRIVLGQHYGDEDTIFNFFVPTGADLDLWWFGAHPFLPAAWLRKLWDALFYRQEIVSLDGVVLRVTRPRDFLSLYFTFANVALHVRGGKPWLISEPNAKGKPVLTAHFYPQHMQEETFEENSSGGSDQQLPTTPVDVTLSGPTRLSFNLELSADGDPLTVSNLLGWKAGSLRRHDDQKELSGDTADLHETRNTTFELPYRLQMDTAEKSTAFSFLQKPKEEFTRDAPELWHVALEPQMVAVDSAVRTSATTANVTITFREKQEGWKKDDTFTVLEPPEFAGTFVLDGAGPMFVTYTQKVPSSPPTPLVPGQPPLPPSSLMTRTNFDIALANRFVAFKAVDEAPLIRANGVSWANNVFTVKLTAPVSLSPGDVINVSGPRDTNICAEVLGPGTVVVESVPQPDTITFAGTTQGAVNDTSSISILSYGRIVRVVVAPDRKTVHVTTDVPHGQRVGDTPFLLATGITGLDGQTHRVTASDDAQTLEIVSAKLLTPEEVLNKGRLVATRMYPITSNDRTQVAQLSQLQPLSMEQLILSALGGWASVEGNFNPVSGKKQDVTRFIYRFAQRRDYYVEVDYEGFLWPFGHRAVLLKMTQRFFYDSKNPVAAPELVENVAYLRTRFFVVVKQKTRNYIAAGLQGLQLPFTRIDFLTDCTPALYAAGTGPDSACSGWFWPSTSIGTPGPAPPPPPMPVMFRLRGYDNANPANTVDFVAPLIFVNGVIGTQPPNATTQAVEAEYTSRTFGGPAGPKRCRVNFGGAPLHFATSATPGDTELHVTSIDFSALLLDPAKPDLDPRSPSTYTVPGDIDPGAPPVIAASLPVVFRPVMVQAEVDVPSVSTFSGKPARPVSVGSSRPQPVTVTYNNRYLETGFNQIVTEAAIAATAMTPAKAAVLQHPNPMEIFVNVTEMDVSLQFPGPTGGGMAVPSGVIKALARHTGPVADPDNSVWAPGQLTPPATPPHLDPMKTFNLGDAKLLGCIPIGEAIEVIADLGANLNLAPSLNLQKVYSAIEAAVSTVATVENAIKGVEDKLDQFNDAVRAVVDKTTAKLNDGLQSWTTKAIGTAGNENDPINCLAQLYNQHAASLKATLTMMQGAANGPVPQYEFDDLRAAGDIALSSDMTQRVVSRLDETVTKLSNTGVIAVCTLQDLDKKLRALVVSALRQLSPDNLPTIQVATALDELIECFDPKLGVPSVAKVREKALALQKAVLTLWKTLARTRNSIDPRLFDTFLTSTVKSLKSDAENALAELKDPQPPVSANDWGKGLLQRALHDHKVAFLALYAQFNKTYCGGHLPATPTYQATAELAETYVNQAQVMGKEALDQAINNTLSGLADNVAAVLTQPILGELQTAMNQFDAALALCNEVVDALQTPVSVTATYTLAKIPMKDAPSGDPIFLAHRVSEEGAKKAQLEIDATVSAGLTPLQPQNATASASTQVILSDFSLQLLPGAPFITVQFDNFKFTAGTGQGTQSHCTLDPVKPVILGGALEFVNQLVSAFAPMGGGGSSPVISLFGSGLGVGYNFKLPKIQAGGFQISGLAFEALLLLSFTGDPLKLRFYLATPQKHFLMSAGIFGGGGFFGLELSSAGVDLVQGCMEFGATAALNLAVASGEVHILGGFYFEFGDRRCLLTGFVRAGGSLNILGIVEMSVEFYIGLTYRKISDQTSVYGTCTVTVSISILFFSADVSMTMEWQWAGSPGNNNTARLETGASLPLYAMLETGASLPLYAIHKIGHAPDGIADESVVYVQNANSEPCPAPPKCNPRLVGWTEEMWKIYTAAFMED